MMSKSRCRIAISQNVQGYDKSLFYMLSMVKLVEDIIQIHLWKHSLPQSFQNMSQALQNCLNACSITCCSYIPKAAELIHKKTKYPFTPGKQKSAANQNLAREFGDIKVLKRLLS